MARTPLAAFLNIPFLVSDREDGYPPQTAGMTTGCSLVLLLSYTDTHIVCEIMFKLLHLRTLKASHQNVF